MSFAIFRKREQQPTPGQGVSKHLATPAVSKSMDLDIASTETAIHDVPVDDKNIVETCEPKTPTFAAPDRVVSINIDPTSVSPKDSEDILCDAMLPLPLDSVRLETQSEAFEDGTVFYLVGRVGFSLLGGVKNPAEKTYNRLKQMYKSFAEQNNTIFTEKGDGSFVAVGANGSQIVISRSRDSYQAEKYLYVSNSYIPEGYKERLVAIDPPKYTSHNVQSGMGDIVDGLEHAINTTIQWSKTDVPQTEINIRSRRSAEAIDTPSNIQDEFGVERPKVSFDEIGGQLEAKHEIEGLALAFANPDIYRSYGTQPPKGVLLYGPPGTGKTLAAKLLASQADSAFFAITPTDVSSMWYGDSERKMQNIFDAAAKEPRSIIYFDEIDAITPDRNNAHEASQRVISVVLQNLDGMKANDNIMVVASTNRLEAIDKALLRPGRFDRTVKMQLPEKQDRIDICKIHANKAEKVADRKLFADDIDWDALADKSEQFSGAELSEVIRRSLEKKARAHAATGQKQGGVSMEELAEEVRAFQHERGKSSK